MKTETVITDQYRITRTKDRYLVRGKNRRFTLNERETGKWSLFGIDFKGFRKRKRFEVKDLEEALSEAEKPLFGSVEEASDLPIVELLRKQVTAKVDEGLEKFQKVGQTLPDNVVSFPNPSEDGEKVQRKYNEKDKKLISANPNSQKP